MPGKTLIKVYGALYKCTRVALHYRVLLASMACDKHRHRVVCVNVSAWKASTESVDQLMGQLQAEERTRCNRFRMDIDKKRSLVGRILLRWMAHAETSQPWGDIQLARTKDNKPYLVAPRGLTQSNFNMNVSHHGNWVAGTSSSDAIVGVDVMRYERPRGCKSVPDFFDTMRQYFTPHEWAYIEAEENVDEVDEEYTPAAQRKTDLSSPPTSSSITVASSREQEGEGSDAEDGETKAGAMARASDKLSASEFTQLRKFYLHWALKESYIKAIGVGLGFELSRAEFRFLAGTSPVRENVQLFIDGVHQTRWSFYIHEPDPEHCVVVGFGPFADATPHFQEVLQPGWATGKPTEVSQGNPAVEFCTRAVPDLKERDQSN